MPSMQYDNTLGDVIWYAEGTTPWIGKPGDEGWIPKHFTHFAPLPKTEITKPPTYAELHAEKRAEALARKDAKYKRDLRRAFIDALLCAWANERRMGAVVNRTFILMAEFTTEVGDRYLLLEGLLRIAHIDGGWPVRKWVDVYAKPLSEALWAGRDNEYCALMAWRCFGGAKLSLARLKIKTRARDKRHDWGTVK